MTNAQFAALAALIKMRGGPSQEAARLALVDGIDVASIVSRLRISQQGVSIAIKRAREGYASAPHVLLLAERALGLAERENINKESQE